MFSTSTDSLIYINYFNFSQEMNFRFALTLALKIKNLKKRKKKGIPILMYLFFSKVLELTASFKRLS